MDMERYLPRMGPPPFVPSQLNRSDRQEIRSRLLCGMTHDEREYQAVLSYLHRKYADLMDVQEGDGLRFQWRYHPFGEKVTAYDSVGRTDWDMYALVYYDPEWDMEPVAVGGSYLREAGAIRDPYTHKPLEGQVMNRHTSRIRCGHGYVLFVDPHYRGMGLARDQWLTEAQLYRDSNVHYQKENQTYEALKVTLSMFQDQSKCHVLTAKPLERVRPGEVTRIIMDYFDDELSQQFDLLPDGLRQFRNPLDWGWIQREGMTMDELVKPWDHIRKRDGYGSGAQVRFGMNLDRDLYESFKRMCQMDGLDVKQALVQYMRHVTEGR